MNRFYDDGIIIVPDDYPSIQEAINHAKPGDTIIVRDGIYYEDIFVNKKLTLKSENGPTKCIIDGSKIRSALDDVINIGLNADGVTIEGFTIRNSGNSWEDAGIAIRSNNNNILHNNILNNRKGIVLWSSSNNKIYNCNITDNEIGIYSAESNNNSIYNCNIKDNTQEGIDLDGTNNVIYDCNIMNNKLGIYIWISNNNNIYNCNISNNTLYGIYLFGSHNNDISNCSFINDGICMFGNILSHFIHSIENNTVNGKPLLYYKDMEDIVLDGVEVGEIILVKCSDFEIRNMDICNSSVGIEVVHGSRIKIYNSSISNNVFGIRLEYYSDNNSIYNCSITGNQVGIYLYWYSNSNDIYSCSIMKNNNGIKLDYSNTDNIIYNCNIVNNTGFGVYLDDSPSNSILKNNFIKNKFRHHASFVNSFGNFWYRNYWDDLRGIGPKIILGYIEAYIPMFEPPWNRPKFPWINFDWCPALKPYEIDGKRIDGHLL